MMAVEDSHPIGVFDSGIGGLSVLKAIWQELPHERTIYIADQAHVPYGPRPLEQVRGYSMGITRYLLEQGSKLIVVACNAASAAALHHLRAAFQDVPFVGMEPAVKPAVEYTRSGVVGVLATPATFQGALYASVVERFAAGVELIQNTCPGLVMQIEAGELESQETRTILERAIYPMLERGIDTIVLGCTHYPLVIPLIQEIAGPQVRVIDPAPSVARQVRRLLEQHDLLSHSASGSLQAGSQKDVRVNNNQYFSRFYTTSHPEHLGDLLNRLFGIQDVVENATWNQKESQVAVLQ
jgi:glutamate racemase